MLNDNLYVISFARTAIGSFQGMFSSVPATKLGAEVIKGAVVRAGLVDLLAQQLDLRRLDDAEEYLTSDRLVESLFVRSFQVLAELPNNLREIRRYFRGSGFGRVEIKCRRIPVQAESVRRRLPLEGTQPAVLVFARIAGKARAIISRRT